MPKPPKNRPKQKINKRKAEPEPASITTKKSYWLTLMLLLVVVTAVFAFMMNLNLPKTALLIAAIVVLIGFVGYIQVTPSSLSLSKRATFVFVGASIIGFSIWAVIVLNLNATGVMLQITDSLGDQFFVVTSLVICLSGGAFIGELIGRNKKVQERLFSKLD